MAAPNWGFRIRWDVDETFDLLVAARLPGVGPKRVAALALRGPLREALARPDEHADILAEPARRALRSRHAHRAAEEELRDARRKGLRIVGWDEPEYPALLREIYDPPPVLTVRGPLYGDEGRRSVAIVGSRAASPQGRALTGKMACDLASWGATVVSGLARGIDSAAHRGALEAEGRTVAVLGSGLDCIYPQENMALSESIAGSGAVVSEYALGTGPLPQNFPRRNRIIAGWGVAVVVVEAPERSGALITARVALEEGRDVLAVPGHPSWPGAAGTNQLIRDGAGLVRSALDVAAEMGLRVCPSKEGPAPEQESGLLGALRTLGPANIEDLQARWGRPMGELLSLLAELEVQDKVRRLPGGLFVRS